LQEIEKENIFEDVENSIDADEADNPEGAQQELETPGMMLMRPIGLDDDEELENIKFSAAVQRELIIHSSY
jgi:hypothetical protein